MTRINVVPPSELTDKHLVAEYRELPRVFALSRRWEDRGRDTLIPSEYVLGPGHVAFFYNKLEFLFHRYNSLAAEMMSRNFTVRYPLPPLLKHSPDLMNDWKPTAAAVRVNRRRIHDRLTTKRP